MAEQGNWKGNPPVQSESADTAQDRGMLADFNATNPDRKTGKVGMGSMEDNMVPDSAVEPEGRPAR